MYPRVTLQRFINASLEGGGGSGFDPGLDCWDGCERFEYLAELGEGDKSSARRRHVIESLVNQKIIQLCICQSNLALMKHSSIVAHEGF